MTAGKLLKLLNTLGKYRQEVSQNPASSLFNRKEKTEMPPKFFFLL